MVDIKTIIYLLKGLWVIIDYINHKNTQMKIYEGVSIGETIFFSILWVVGVLLIVAIVGGIFYIGQFIING